MLTEHQVLNTVAPSYSERIRYFAGISYEALLRQGVAATFASWTGPDAGRPAGWTEITERVSWQSTLNQRQQGASITFEVTLQGTRYDRNFLGIGQAMVAWQQFYRPTGTATAPAGWQPWRLAFVGGIIRCSDADDYTHAARWQRVITGQNGWLAGKNAPRMTAGKINIMQDATLEGSPHLAVPETFRDKGEFVGGSQDVSLERLKDNNPNTVYISDMIPGGPQPPDPPTGWDLGCQFAEIFVKPIAGWPSNMTWWIELYNQRANDPEGVPGTVILATWNGGNPRYWHLKIDPLKEGAWGIICANKTYFDLYNGGTNSGAQWIKDATKEIPDLANFDPLDGMVFLAGTWTGMVWAPGGANRVYEEPNHPYWDPGPTLNSTTLPEDQSWTFNFSGYDRRIGDWTLNAYPHPGGNDNGEGPVWIKATLPENKCLTEDPLPSGASVIRLNNYQAWMAPPAGQWAYGIVAGYKFRWNSRDASGLKGVQWLDVPAAEIPKGTQCYPYANGMAQTGYPLVSTALVRRRFPTVNRYQVWWSQLSEAPNYLQGGWQASYHAHHHEIQNNTQLLRIPDPTADSAGAYLWVRHFMYLIYRMTDGLQVRLNEIEAELAQSALDFSGLPDLDGRRSYELAAYLIRQWLGLPAADFVDASSWNAHFMGQHALAITPVTKVLDDLARATGCLVWYAPDGRIYWLDDPRWAFSPVTWPEYAFDATAVRGEVKVAEDQVLLDYVILNALSIEGNPHPVRYVYPQTKGGAEPPAVAITREIPDLVIARDADAKAVAEREFNNALMGGKTATLTVKGIGEWCRPGLRVDFAYDFNGWGVVENAPWLIEAVTTTRDLNGQERRRTTVITLRSAFVSSRVVAL